MLATKQEGEAGPLFLYLKNLQFVWDYYGAIKLWMQIKIPELELANSGFSYAARICRFSMRFQLINPYRSLTRNVTKQMMTER